MQKRYALFCVYQSDVVDKTPLSEVLSASFAEREYFRIPGRISDLHRFTRFFLTLTAVHGWTVVCYTIALSLSSSEIDRR